MQYPLSKTSEIAEVPISPIAAANVASVPQRSPLRYPGGKTWLVPHIRVWLNEIHPRPATLIEPFAGGGIVSLTAVMENLVQQSVMAEIDANVAAFWKAALEHNAELRQRVSQFYPTRESIEELQCGDQETILDLGFRSLVLNRTRRGGILAKGAALSRNGENGKGLMSRWYPETTMNRLAEVAKYSHRITFLQQDGLRLLEQKLANGTSDTVVFADPPYTFGGKKAGGRLYDANTIDHRRLFSVLASSGVDFLMTYDRSPEILDLISKFGFYAVQVFMKNTHHNTIPELIITRRPVFSDD